MTRGSDKCRRTLGGEKRQGQICRRGAAPRWFPERSKPPSQPAQPACPAHRPGRCDSQIRVRQRRLGSERRQTATAGPLPEVAKPRWAPEGASLVALRSYPPWEAPSQAAQYRSPEPPLPAPAPGTQRFKNQAGSFLKPSPLGAFQEQSLVMPRGSLPIP